MLLYADYETSNELNWYSDDPILTRYAKRYLSKAMLDYVESSFVKTGELASGPIDRRAVHTDRDGAPKLIRYNRKGEEINEIWYNEGYLQTVREGYGTGVVAYRYDENAPEQVPFLVNSILIYLLCEAEPGFTCPVGLTQSVAFVLEKFGSEAQKIQYLSRLASLDPETFEQGATFLTEIQGGSDVGATQTVAVQEGNHYLLTGEKWFASNCDAEISIALARVNDRPSTRGLGLFLVPRTLQDGRRNTVSIRRLKDKLGVRAVASGELVMDKAVGYLIGTQDEGFKYMAEALNVSRLGTALSGLALARRAVLEGAIYTSQRIAFGSPVSRYPMVRQTLADVMVEVEAGWALTAQTIRLFDEVHTYGDRSSEKVSVLRILLSLAKLNLSELGVTAAKRTMELHGGNGYIEEYVTPRMLRDALVNPIWEGTANIQALEVLKNLQKGGTKPWLTLLEQTMQRIQHPEALPLRNQLAAHTASCQTLIAHVLEQDTQVQTGLASKLAVFMYKVFAAVHLLEEAQYDLVEFGDKRRLLAARYFEQMALTTDPVHDILQNHIVSEELFLALVAFQAVPVEMTVD